MKYYQDRFKMRSPSDDTNENRFLSPCFVIRSYDQRKLPVTLKKVWCHKADVNDQLYSRYLANGNQTMIHSQTILASWYDKSGKPKEFFLFFFDMPNLVLISVTFPLLFSLPFKVNFAMYVPRYWAKPDIYIKRLKYHQTNRLFGSSWTNVLMWTGANKWESRTSLNSSLKRCFHCSGCPNELWKLIFFRD